MAESTLSLGWADYKAETGYYLGYGRDSANWSAGQLSEIQSYVKSGIRQFYQPPVLPGEKTPYDWSFLHINTTIATVASTYNQTLPDSFGGIEDGFTFATTDKAYSPVQIVGEGRIRALREGNTYTGFPRHAAIRPMTATGTTGQRFEVIWWPTPDAVYTMGYRYRVQQDAPSDTYPYVLGGSVHCETILASCLAVAEERGDDTRGVRKEAYVEKLIASVYYDRKALGNQFFGYNGDRSDHRSFDFRRVNNVTVNSVEYP